MVAAVGIITGAFGAHGLKKRPGMDADKIHSWETAAHYAVCYVILSVLFHSFHYMLITFIHPILYYEHIIHCICILYCIIPLHTNTNTNRCTTV